MKVKITDTLYFDIEDYIIKDIKTSKSIFSIYKINNSFSKKDVFNHINQKLNEKNASIINIENNGFEGFLYSNFSKPYWMDTIVELVPVTPKDFSLFNSTSSFILFKEVSMDNSENIYVICGGRGYNIISSCIEKNFGLNLVPKLVSNEDFLVKQVSESQLLGNHIFNARRNRNVTTIISESEYSNIFNELELSVGNDIMSKLGFDTSNDNHTNIITKHAIRISKSITLNQLSEIIFQIDKINSHEMNFPLNQFILATKKGYKKDLIKKLFKQLIKNNENDYYSFEIINENILDYSLNLEFKIQSSDESFQISSKNPFLWDDLINRLNKFKLTDKLLENIFFKGKIIIDNGESEESYNLFDCLNGYLIDEIQEQTFYLINGDWFVIDKSFEKINNEKFNEIFQYSKDYYINNIRLKFPIFERKIKEYKDSNGNLPNESDYNAFFKNNHFVIYADKKPHKKVEIADLIVYDESDEILYLFCLKNNFASGGCRDLFGQIESSANSIQFKLRNMADNTLSMYYQDLVNNNGNNIVDKDTFKNYFNKKICYVAGFFKGFRKNSNSDYGKILSYQINKKLKRLGFDFIIIDFSFSIYDD